MRSTNLLCSVLLGALAAAMAVAQTPSSEGIPISDPLTISKCGGCHQRDANGMMRRLSYIRTTPEVWEESIRRMVRLNGVVLKPEEAHQILKYLSYNNGLAPAEDKPVFWEAEHRLFRDQSDKIPDNALQHTCNYCHTIGRVLSQRRTKEDYEKLINMHLGMFPGAENTLRPRRPVNHEAMPAEFQAPSGSNPSLEEPQPPTVPVRADGKYPGDVAIDYLAKAQPLITPQWTAWKAIMRTPQLEGKWMLVGYQKGKGRVFGTLTISAGSAPDEFVTKTEVEYATSGLTYTRTGKGIVYTGYSWRGRSTGPSTVKTADPGTNPTEWREALFVSRDGNTMDGRWFWGGYQEFGIDAHLVRIGTTPMLAGASTFAIQTPSTKEVTLYGANFPADLKPSEFDFGSGITVRRIVKHTPSTVTVEVEAKAGLPTGFRDISFERSTTERAFAVYDKIAYIKVLPDASMARLGGTIAPKQFAQFEAVAYAAGADGKAQTADDIPIGPVTAHWSLEEFVSTPDDDDVKYVGKINDTGLFTPNLEGPDPVRKKASNNYPTDNWGDVWVDATFDTPDGQAMKARSYLVVTIPVYVRYDQPEVGQ
ncbi:MAG TPA: quinohemoprotein amine dehydrogenase subunit alpha [Bryobacteraceae bacterium]|nr:quinohemoprotein amine dehydrogenase subunit alpha [Bryobacteraceae bacterium]